MPIDTNIRIDTRMCIYSCRCIDTYLELTQHVVYRDRSFGTEAILTAAALSLRISR